MADTAKKVLVEVEVKPKGSLSAPFDDMGKAAKQAAGDVSKGSQTAMQQVLGLRNTTATSAASMQTSFGQASAGAAQLAQSLLILGSGSDGIAKLTVTIMQFRAAIDLARGSWSLLRAGTDGASLMGMGGAGIAGAGAAAGGTGAAAAVGLGGTGAAAAGVAAVGSSMALVAAAAAAAVGTLTALDYALAKIAGRESTVEKAMNAEGAQSWLAKPVQWMEGLARMQFGGTFEDGNVTRTSRMEEARRKNQEIGATEKTRFAAERDVLGQQRGIAEQRDTFGLGIQLARETRPAVEGLVAGRTTGLDALLGQMPVGRGHEARSARNQLRESGIDVARAGAQGEVAAQRDVLQAQNALTQAAQRQQEIQRQIAETQAGEHSGLIARSVAQARIGILEKESLEAAKQRVGAEQAVIAAMQKQGEAQKASLEMQKQFVREQKNAAQAKLDAEMGRRDSAQSEFGLMSKSEQRKQSRIAEKLATGKDLTQSEIGVARGSDLLREKLQDYGRQKAEANPEWMKFARDSGQNARVDQARQSVNVLAKAELAIKQEINASLNVNEDIVGQMATKVMDQMDKIPDLVNQVWEKAQAQAAASRANQEAMAGRG